MSHKPRKRDKKTTAKAGSRPRKNAPARESAKSGPDWIYGRHAVEALLANEDRKIMSLVATDNAASDFSPFANRRALAPALKTATEISALLPPGAVHQGIAAKAHPLTPITLEDLPLTQSVIVLDQVTDPHNVGAILRSCAVFNASALIMTQRNSPPLTGVLAKSACGALEHVDVIYVGNLSQALKKLGKLGFMRIGLAGDANEVFEELSMPAATALVLGAEDKGLRRLTRENCDQLCRITTKGPLASLNVSNAAAIALHTLCQKIPMGSR